MNAIITFKDGGQDFTEWHVENNVVVACYPFQSEAWIGCRVINDYELAVGGRVIIQTKPPQPQQVAVRHPIKGLRIFPDIFAYEVDIEVKDGIERVSFREVLRVKSYAQVEEAVRWTKGAVLTTRVMPLSKEEWQRVYGRPAKSEARPAPRPVVKLKRSVTITPKGTVKTRRR